MKYKVTIQAACRIAHIDRDRFNEAVAAGNYGCAPAVRRGATRLFEEQDLISLFFYGWMIVRQYPPRIAGRIACCVRKVLDDFSDTDEVIVVEDTSGTMAGFAIEKINGKQPRYLAGSPVMTRTSVDIGNIRKIVQKGVDFERSIIGEED